MTATFDAVRARRSHSKVTTDAPSHAELLPYVAAAARAADHGAILPWRLIELRGTARDRLGAAFVEAGGRAGEDAGALALKPLRAPLLVAIVARRVPRVSVAEWEQDACAAGVAHLLSLLLTDAGWGVMWRTGEFTRSRPVRDVHRLAESEALLGWLYVGGVPPDSKPGVRRAIDPEAQLSVLV